MRLFLLLLAVAMLCVIGIDKLTTKPIVPMDQWVCEPTATSVMTNNGPFYFRE